MGAYVPLYAGAMHWCRRCGETDERALYPGRNLCRPCGRKSSLAHIQRRRDAISELKLAKGCAVCGYNRSAAALELDHERDDKGHWKRSTLSAMITQTGRVSLDELLAAAGKCQVLCANCHREKTARLSEWGRRS